MRRNPLAGVFRIRFFSVAADVERPAAIDNGDRAIGRRQRSRINPDHTHRLPERDQSVLAGLADRVSALAASPAASLSDVRSFI
jgi:hypothetical protein